MKKYSLKEIAWPNFDTCKQPDDIVSSELEKRLADTRAMMERRNLTHLVVYADREHFANLMYLAHFDPRFEEALLIVDLKNNPLILVGNECKGHLNMSPLFQEEKLRYEVFQPLSLLSQPRDNSRTLKEIFLSEGIHSQSRIGCVGWKYYSEKEDAQGKYAMEVPSYMVDTLRGICSYDRVENATDMFMNPENGLRSEISPYEIAYFEYANVLASEGMKNLLNNVQVGMTDYELVSYYKYTGMPLAFHIGMKCGGNKHIGLSSPGGHIIHKGDPFSTNIGYWGSNSCRAGWIAQSENDLPEESKGYIDAFAGPYFQVMSEWYKNLKIGTAGGVLADIIFDNLPFEQFGIFLNPGHLIHLDEWVSSPVYRGSNIELRSGMYMQVDVIPRSKNYFSTRMEDGIVLADRQLRETLKSEYPHVYHRCRQRRKFMIETLGLELPEEILPLSNIPGIVVPFMLRPELVFVID